MLHVFSTLYQHLSSAELSHKIICVADDGIRSTADLKDYQPIDLDRGGVRRAQTPRTCQHQYTPRQDSTCETRSSAPPTVRRPDFPTLRGNVDRKAAKRKLETSAEARDEAIAALIRDQYANSTRSTTTVAKAVPKAMVQPKMASPPLPGRLRAFPPHNASAAVTSATAEEDTDFHCLHDHG
jgi:hypothetical protein